MKEALSEDELVDIVLTIVDVTREAEVLVGSGGYIILPIVAGGQVVNVAPSPGSQGGILSMSPTHQ